MVSIHEEDEDEIPMYDVLYYLCKDHISLQTLEIHSTSYHGSDFAKDSKVFWYVENEIFFVDPCHKKDCLMCEPLEGENLVEDLICEPPHLSGSIKDDRDNLMESMNNFVYTNALATICCWKASVRELEG